MASNFNMATVLFGLFIGYVLLVAVIAVVVAVVA